MNREKNTEKLSKIKKCFSLVLALVAEFQYSVCTVLVLCLHSSSTVSTQFQYSVYTVLALCLHSYSTLSTQFQYCVYTVLVLCLHSSSTMSTQFQYYVDTVLVLCRHSSSTMSTQFQYYAVGQHRKTLNENTAVPSTALVVLLIVRYKLYYSDER